ncbi:MAG: hypothetical protein WBA12_09640 [Catalinimonas sp.]
MHKTTRTLLSTALLLGGLLFTQSAAAQGAPPPPVPADPPAIPVDGGLGLLLAAGLGYGINHARRRKQ